MDLDSSSIEQILQAIQQAETVCIVGHVLPDGDCIGSTLALGLALKQLGKKVHCWNENKVPHKLSFLDPSGLIQRPQPGLDFDVVIALDCATFERLGSAGSATENHKVFINIDHHQSNTLYGDFNWVVGESASTGELVFQLLEQLKVQITPEMANCLFAAISTDTGSFQYAGTNPKTFAMAGRLLELGAQIVHICREVYQSYPIARIRLLRQVLNNFKLTENNQIAYYWLKPADFSRSGAVRADAEGLIDHIRSIEPVIVAVQFEEIQPEVIRVSMRSKNELVDVSEISRHFNGGGHKGASGATINGTRLSVQRKVVKMIRQTLRMASNSQKEQSCK